MDSVLTRLAPGQWTIRGLFSGGSLCGEAASILDKNGEILAKSAKYKAGVKRTYVYPRYFSHVIGYSSAKYGSSGLEALFNKELMSSSDTMEDLRSKINDYYIKGNNINLTLERSLQVYASDLLRGKKGAVVVLKTDTGEILALASKPDFDPSGIQNNWESLINDKKSPLPNRASEGLYPRGSIFKLAVASSILKNDLRDIEVECTGEVTACGYIIKDSDGKAHGSITLSEALKYCCNSYYIKQGLKLGNSNLYNEAVRFRLNKKIQTDIRAVSYTHLTLLTIYSVSISVVVVSLKKKHTTSPLPPILNLTLSRFSYNY